MNTPDDPPAIRRTLEEAMGTFVRKIFATRLGNDEEDTPMRQIATEEYRAVVEAAAAQGVEDALSWHSLAMWTDSGKERIGYFSRVLECVRAAAAEPGEKTPQARWSAVQLEADSLYEIGRVHAHEGDPEVARGFLEQALVLARLKETLGAEIAVRDDNLEGRVAALLLQLPDAAGE